MRVLISLAIIFSTFFLGACSRIETGEVGVRVGFDKMVAPGELLPGSFNQTILGDVLTFPVKDVNVVLENLTPIAKDNSTMKDLDIVVVYNIAANQVSELYATKNRSFHTEMNGDILLMYNYVVQNARNGLYKAARQYEALEMADNRESMEQFVKDEIIKNLVEEKLDGSITVSQVLIRNVVPADSVVESANALVRAKNEFRQKGVEVQTAQEEAKRIQALNSNAGAIQYMDAQARLMYAEAAKLQAAGIKEFKGTTLVIGNAATPVVPLK